MSTFLKSPLEVPSMSEAARIGLNVFAIKLLVESVPGALARLKKAGLLDLTGPLALELVLTAKDGERFKVVITQTGDVPTAGDGSL